MLTLVLELFHNPGNIVHTTSTFNIIDEVHYNTSIELGEAVEIAGSAGTDDSGWCVTCCNDAIGAVNGTNPVNGTITVIGSSFGADIVNYPVNGMQDRCADGGSRFPEKYDKDLTTHWVVNNSNLVEARDHTSSPGPVKALNISELKNETFVPPCETCGDPFTAIFTIQVSGLASLQDGSEVSTEGIVIGDFQDGKEGFYIQDTVGDGDSATSDGIFVYSTHLDVKVGDPVRVRGTWTNSMI